MQKGTINTKEAEMPLWPGVVCTHVTNVYVAICLVFLNDCYMAQGSDTVYPCVHYSMSSLPHGSFSCSSSSHLFPSSSLQLFSEDKDVACCL